MNSAASGSARVWLCYQIPRQSSKQTTAQPQCSKMSQSETMRSQTIALMTDKIRLSLIWTMSVPYDNQRSDLLPHLQGEVYACPNHLLRSRRLMAILDAKSQYPIEVLPPLPAEILASEV